LAHSQNRHSMRLQIRKLVESMAAGRPNIIMICADQLRYDGFGCTGNAIARTPNIDSVAARGTSFTNHYASCTICAPSRASLFTGTYPRKHGLVKNGLALPQSKELFTNVMMDGGVYTHGVGKLHFQPILAKASYGMPESNSYWGLPQTQEWTGPCYGFQTTDLVIGESFTSVKGGHYGKWIMENHPEVAPLYLPENALDRDPDDMDEVWRSAVPAELHYNSWIADRSVEFLKKRAQDDPFFLFVSFPDPHHPFAPPLPYADNFDPAAMPSPRYVEGELDLI